MNLLWLIFILLSFILSFIVSLLFKKRILKIFSFSLVLTILLSIWFKNPGENYLSPVFTIFILEATILENQGYERILRPFLLTFIIVFTFSFLFWRKSKS